MEKIEPTSPAIQASEMHKDASRRLGRPNPEAEALANAASIERVRKRVFDALDD